MNLELEAKTIRSVGFNANYAH